MSYQQVFAILERSHQPTMLEQFSHFTPFQNLIATLLSARTKDSTVIPKAKELFKKYPDPEDFIKLDNKVLEKELFGIGFYRNKARFIKELSLIIKDKYKGMVPNSFEALISLPGVGRKTANCVLSYVFHQPTIAVDTHVHRISNRLGWINTKIPEETEEELKNLLPKEGWSKINMLFVDHGQRICLPIKPKCRGCEIIKFCKYGKNNL